MRVGMGAIVLTNATVFTINSHQPIAIVLWTSDDKAIANKKPRWKIKDKEAPRTLHVVGANGRETDISIYNVDKVLTEKELDPDIFLTAHPRFLANYKILRDGEKK